MEYYDLDKDFAFLVSQKAIIVKDNKILILQYPPTEEPDWVDTWGLPGGLLEMNELMADGIKREVKEETQLEIKVGRVIGSSDFSLNRFVFKDKRKMKVRIIQLGYLCKYVSGIVTLSDEHQDYKWVSINQLNSIKFSPDSKKIIENYLKN